MCVLAAAVIVAGVFVAMIWSNSWPVLVVFFAVLAMLFQVATLWATGVLGLAIRAVRQRRGGRGSVVESAPVRAVIVGVVAAFTTAAATTVLSVTIADREVSLDDVRLLAASIVLAVATVAVAVVWMAGLLGDVLAAVRQLFKRR